MTKTRALTPKCPKCGYIIELPKRKKARSEKAEETYRGVVEQTRHNMSSSGIARKFNISRQRVWQIQQEHARENALSITNEPIEFWIGEALDNYKTMLEKGFNLLDDAEKIKDQKDQVNARAQAISKLVDAQRAVDSLFKQSGVYKETSMRMNINVSESPEWRQLEGLIVAFLESKRIDPTEFVEFVEKAKKPRYRYSGKASEEEEATDVEYEEVE